MTPQQHRQRLTPGLRLYRGFSRLLEPVIPIWGMIRARRNKEDGPRLPERRGQASIPRPAGPLIWFHGASVGECRALLPLVRDILAEHATCQALVTCGTLSAANWLRAELPDRAQHQFSPWDTPGSVGRFFDHWRPDLGILVESELWPNLIMAARTRQIPLALINARMSPKSLKRWQERAPASLRTLLQGFVLILAADRFTAASLSKVTGSDISHPGNIKFAKEDPAPQPAALQPLRTALAGRPIWCATSTHTGEDEWIIRAHQDLQSGHDPQSVLLLAPRHIERTPALTRLISAQGLTSLRRSSQRLPRKDTDIYLLDTWGELDLAYALADVAFIGGSLLPALKGHNPLEAIRADTPVIAGPYTESFRDIYDELARANAYRLVSSETDLCREVTTLMQDAQQRQQFRENASEVAKSHESVRDIVLSTLRPWMPEPKKGITRATA